MIIKEDRDNEYSANQHLATAESGLHIFVKTKGKRKSIAGPFASKEEAEAHPARKFGDGVCKKEMCEGTMELEEAKLLKESSLNEAKKSDNYHSVFSKGKNEDKWCHHMDCDTKEDAHDEVRSIKDQGDHAKHLVVPKEEAKWHKMDGDSIHNYVKSHDKKSVSESFVNSLINGDKITAGNYFKDILKTNISTLLDSRKVEIAKTMFHGKTK